MYRTVAPLRSAGALSRGASACPHSSGGPLLPVIPPSQNSCQTRDPARLKPVPPPRHCFSLARSGLRIRSHTAGGPQRMGVGRRRRRGPGVAAASAELVARPHNRAGGGAPAPATPHAYPLARAHVRGAAGERPRGSGRAGACSIHADCVSDLARPRLSTSFFTRSQFSVLAPAGRAASPPGLAAALVAAARLPGLRIPGQGGRQVRVRVCETACG